ncbi:ceramide transfer protein-like isoform X2 [Xenia sp. Carnegie-2017]|uniref:ceramide transfer protein-like isoform X2 n=1 Tax=Xenia sp. Carnegie-2017 TaxID=2897299 RepID=UPI001F0438ED|nr:ceramide transfer protein-like isoform X2 [Xenia sp. Carnegie-2017]
MSDEHSLSISEEDDDETVGNLAKERLVEKEGYLSKWTNYIHGWQDRYVVLQHGNIAYFKNKADRELGCRGSLSLGKAVIEIHKFDECRFDVRVNDSVYYLRTAEPDERQSWIDMLEAFKDSGYGSETNLRKNASMLSLSSVTSLTLSSTSSSSFKKGHSLREKLMEMETFRDILCRQVDTLQTYFDSCAASEGESSIHDHADLTMNDDMFEDAHLVDHDADDEMDELSSTPTPSSLMKKRSMSVGSSTKPQNRCAIDFKGEAITFKATTAGILATMSHCIDLLTKKEEHWKRKYEKEVEKRKRIEEHYKKALVNAKKKSFVSGPDFVEGPHMMLNEEEFYDAVETALDKHDEEEMSDETDIHGCEMTTPAECTDKFHPHSNEVDVQVRESLKVIQEDVDENWTLVFEDGEMQVHRRDYEEGGIVLDPLKATHVVQGVTGREMTYYFFDKDVRMDWDTTLDVCKVIEIFSPSTMLFHQVYKRVWPSSQRETVFMSHLREIPSSDVTLERLENEVGNPWLSINYSIDHPAVPVNKYVRATCNVAFFCQTMISPRSEGEELTRDHVSCKITYSCTVNPGGWAPPSVVRAVSKRECPKFLRKIGTFCQTVFKEKDIML